MKKILRHPLHVAVANVLQQRLSGRGDLLKNLACGGKQHLPLFIGTTKNRIARMCEVDLLIVSENQVRVIIEIEESGFLPTKICGKFLQSAIATHYIHNSLEEPVISYSNHVLFIQVLDGSSILKDGARKDKQVELIEHKIRGMLPLKESSIIDYRVFFIMGDNDSTGLEFGKCSDGRCSHLTSDTTQHISRCLTLFGTGRPISTISRTPT